VHRFGTTTLVRQPVRVVTVGLVDQDAFLALGVVPVATREWFGRVPGAIFPWAQPKLGDHPLPFVLDNTLNFAQVAAQRPDVIVALYASLSQGDYAALSAIAPTVVAPASFGEWGMPWQEITLTVGRILGRPMAARTLVAQVNQSFAAARQAHPRFEGQSAAIISGYGWPRSYYAYGPLDSRARFLADLGFTLPPELESAAGTSFGAAVPVSHLNWVDRSLVVWLTTSPDQGPLIRSDPRWAATRASREGRDVYLPVGSPYYSALNFASVLSLPYAITGLIPTFEAALDGNPTR
jgi:iron complex transport system substrate-binding protein